MDNLIQRSHIDFTEMECRFEPKELPFSAVNRSLISSELPSGDRNESSTSMAGAMDGQM